MVSVLKKLYKKRAQTGNLGELGPCRFEELLPFLERATTRDATHAVQPVQVGITANVVAFGDIHGDLLVLLGLLYMAGVINQEANWIGGSKYVVQCGDFTDRGGRSNTVNTSKNRREELDIVQYVHALNKQARESGGCVVSVVGNHELSHVWPQTNENEQDEQGWGDYSVWRAGNLMAKYLSLFCPLILQLNDFLFMHGGLLSGSHTPAELNEMLRVGLETGSTPSNAVWDVVWSRKLSSPNKLSDQDCTTTTKTLFKQLGLDWHKGGIVVGHTVQNSISSFCSGKVWRLDLAMSEAFGRSEQFGAIKIYLKPSKDTVVKSFQVEQTMSGNSVNTTKLVKCYRNGVEFNNEKASSQFSFSRNVQSLLMPIG